uniref:Uncharacterized protein n=1 Tax=Solanum lycopersicum TaxID=4081 RepID=A0A3Q7G5M9_SOLLC
MVKYVKPFDLLKLLLTIVNFPTTVVCLFHLLVLLIMKKESNCFLVYIHCEK